MKILFVGNNDTFGSRFNGFDLNQKLNSMGYDCQLCVFKKNSNSKDVWEIAKYKDKYDLHLRLTRFEDNHSIQSLVYPYFLQFFFDKRFLKADVVHYHIIHAGFFSFLLLPILSRIRPTIWTLHDPWAMTGHCIYPYECKKWKTGCHNCPNLTTPLPMKKDRAAYMWKIKKFCYKHSKVNITVASEYMLKMAEKSPLLKNFKLHLIPYGLNLDLYKPTDTKEARKKMGIPLNATVLSFRAINSEYKGVEYIKEALKKLHTKKKITLITFHEKGLMDEFKDKYQIIDMGWENDDKKIVQAYNASDIFLMPSTAEAFGLMAAEAMACAKPVITFKGTSLEEIVHTPSGGIAVPMRNAVKLRQAIEKLIDNPKLAKKMGQEGRKITEKYYDEKLYLNRIMSLYETVSKKNKK